MSLGGLTGGGHAPALEGVADRGFYSTRGPVGPTGNTGPAGTPGAPGAQGPAGPQGDPGPVGPAGLNWRGLWDPDSAYDVDDAVSWTGTNAITSSYFAVQASTGQEPAEGTSNAYWALLAQEGPPGIQGPQGEQGPQGIQGEPGPGAPAGGTTGQALVKASDDDYDVEWVDPTFTVDDSSGYDTAHTTLPIRMVATNTTNRRIMQFSNVGGGDSGILIVRSGGMQFNVGFWAGARVGIDSLNAGGIFLRSRGSVGQPSTDGVICFEADAGAAGAGRAIVRIRGYHSDNKPLIVGQDYAGNETSLLHATGEYENLVPGGGIILTSPDGTHYRITVANGGTLTVAPA